MAASTKPQPESLAATKPTGFRCRCLACADDGPLVIDLDNICIVKCVSCDATFTADEIEAQLIEWQQVARWLRHNATFLARE